MSWFMDDFPALDHVPGVLAGMMSAEDVAEVVMFCITRPRGHRILETALRPMTEASWG